MKKFEFKRLVSLLLLVCMLSSCFLTGQTNVNYAADANELQINYINLMKGGKAGVTGNTDAIRTTDDLRCVAMFLSQSYVPFYTSLDGDSKDKWIDKGVAMLKQIGFDQQVATTLVNQVYQASLDSATKVNIAADSLGKVQLPLFNGTKKGYGRYHVDGTNAGWFLSAEDVGLMADFVKDYTWLSCPAQNAVRLFNGGGMELNPLSGYESFVGMKVDGSGYSVSSLSEELWSEVSGLLGSGKGWKFTLVGGGDGYVEGDYGQKFYSAANSSSANRYYSLVPHVTTVKKSNEDGLQEYDVFDSVGFALIENYTGSKWGGSSNRLILQTDDIVSGTDGLANSAYRAVVKDEGYSGYTPFTLAMLWSLMDNLYYDYNGIDIEGKTGHVKQDYKPVSLLAKRNTVASSPISDGSSGETEESSETGVETVSSFFDTLTVYATENETETVTDSVSPDDNLETDQTGNVGDLSRVAVLDRDTLGYLSYVLDMNGEQSVGGALNSFSQTDISSLFNKEDQIESDSVIGSLLSPFQCIYVDWVGNLLVDVGTERVIILPACANKCAFTDIEAHNEKQNILSPLYFRLLSNSTVSDTGFVYGGAGECVEIDEVLAKGSSVKGRWDLSGWAGLGDGKGFKEWLKKKGLFTDGWGNNKWTDTLKFCVMKDLDLGKEDVFSDIIVYESIKQSGKGSVTDLSSTLVTTSVLDSWDSYKTYFTSEGSSKFSGGGSYDKYFNFSNNDTMMLQNLFLTYVFAYSNHPYHEAFDKSKHYIDMRFNYDVFPSVSGSIVWESVDTIDDQIKSFIYYLLHPTEGIEYVATWFKNKVSGIFINWHEDVVGSSDSNAVTGMTQYLGFSGYVTTPNLEDISWIASLLSNYNSIIIYLIIIMMVILICYVIVGAITTQRGIMGILMFSFLAFLPPLGINTTVDVINKTCESMYSTKFDYWAAVQTEEYLGLLNAVENANTVTDYVTALMQMNASASASTSTGGASATGYSGVKVKWLSPKKFNEMAAFSDEIQKKIEDSKSGMSGWMVNALVATQEYSSGMEFYLNSDSASYLYRDLLDIYRYGSCSYYLYTDAFGTGGRTFDLIGATDNNDTTSDFEDCFRTASDCVGSKIKMSNDTCLSHYVMANMEKSSSDVGIGEAIRGTSSLTSIRKGFMYPTASNSTSGDKVNYFGGVNNTNAASLLLINNKCIKKAAECYEQLQKNIDDDGIVNLNLTADEIVKNHHNVMYGLGQWNFKGGINEFITGSIGDYGFEKNGGYDGYYYSLYSESPYYYFSFNLRDQVHSSMNYTYDYQSLKNSAGDDDFYKLLIKDNQGYFYNLSENAGDGYGELRDFMNMHDFFYYIMPSLKPGNDLTNLYSDIFDMNISDHSTLHLSSDGKIFYSGTGYDSISEMKEVLEKMTQEELYDFWHDYNVRTVYNAYTPWLNLMYACDYAKPETILVAGKKYTVQNPLDPTSYFTFDNNGDMSGGRYMVFSRSEQKARGIQWTDLTTVERKIITLQENVYAQAIRIMDYYNLSNETLISYMAMLELYEFNKVFSQESLVFGNYTLYPQSYELKAFTYDAYLRLILNGATEGSNYQDELQVTGAKSIYKRILEKTSLFFGIVLLGNDFVAVYLIPMLKLFFLVTIFIISILIIIAATTKLDMPGGGILQAMWKSLVAPLVCYACISIGMAAAVVLFMTTGGGTVTKRFLHISLGDPTMTCIAMLIINIVALILYFKLCKKVFKDFKTYVTSVFDTMTSNVVGAAGRLAGMAAGGGMFNRLGRSDSGFMARAFETPAQRGRNNIPSRDRAKLTERAVTGAGAGGNSVSRSQGSRYDAKITKQQQKQEIAHDKFERAKEKAEKYKRKSEYNPEKLEKMIKSRDKAAGAFQNQVTKRGMIERLAQRRNAYSQEKADNIKKYGRIYGTAKNVGTTLSYAKDKAGMTRDRLAYGVGAVTGRVENFKGDVKQFGSDVRHAPAAIRNTYQKAGGTIKKGVNHMEKIYTDLSGETFRNTISGIRSRYGQAKNQMASAVRKNVLATDAYSYGRDSVSVTRKASLGSKPHRMSSKR